MHPGESLLSDAGCLSDEHREQEMLSGKKLSEERKIEELLLSISGKGERAANAWLMHPFGTGRKTSFDSVLAGLLDTEAMRADRNRGQREPNTG